MSKRYNKSENEEFLMNRGCPSCACQDMDVAVPVAVRAFADVGNVTFRCMGTTIVPSAEEAFNGPGGISRFTILQRMQVEIPIVCNAEANVGEGEASFSKPRLGYDSSRRDTCDCRRDNTLDCNCNRNDNLRIVNGI